MLQAWTKLTPVCVKFKPTSVEQEAFEEIQQIVAKEILQLYPNFNKRFETHTDASNYKLVTVNIQEVKPISVILVRLQVSIPGTL